MNEAVGSMFEAGCRCSPYYVKFRKVSVSLSISVCSHWKRNLACPTCLPSPSILFGLPISSFLHNFQLLFTSNLFSLSFRSSNSYRSFFLHRKGTAHKDSYYPIHARRRISVRELLCTTARTLAPARSNSDTRIAKLVV